MVRTVVLLVLLFTTWSLAATRYAFIVGQNSGGEALGRLRYAEEDARRFSNVLTEIGGFDNTHIVKVFHPDSAEFSEQFNALAELLKQNQDKQNTLFLFYYSGHADSKDLLLDGTRFSLEVLQNKINAISAGIKIGIFDACQSGAVTAFKGGTRAEPFYLQNQQQIKGAVTIASSAASERAQESESLKGSIFTFHWINGLRGSADASADKRVTLTEAYQYAYRKTVETSALTNGEIQHPMYRFNIQGQGDVILTNLEGASGGITIDRNCKGKFLVLSQNYLDVYADFYKEDISEPFISLSPGKYTIVRAQGQDIGTHQFALEKDRKLRITKASFRAVTLTESRIKGSEVSEISTSQSNKSEDNLFTPLSRLKIGIGLGFLMSPGNTGSDKRNLHLDLNGSYYLNKTFDLVFGLYAHPVYLNGGIDAGLDYMIPLEFGKIGFGAFAGCEIHSDKSLYGGNRADPYAGVHAGLIADLSKRLQFQISIPYYAVFGNELTHRIGAEFRLLISGRFKDVAVLD